MKTTIDDVKVTIDLNKPFPFRDEDVEKLLLEEGFTRPKDREGIVLRIGADGVQSQATHWIREETDAFYEQATGRLAVEGRSLEQVGESFERILRVTHRLLESTEEVNIHWTELLVRLRAYGSPPPLEIFRHFCESKARDAVSEALGEEMHAFSLALYSADKKELDRPLNKIEDWVHLAIAPLVPNPSVYTVSLVYRKRDPKDVKKRLETLAGTLERIWSTLGVAER